VSVPKYDGRAARAILGAYSEQAYPPATRVAKREAALELLQAIADLEIPGVTVMLAQAGRPIAIKFADGKGHFGDPLLVAEIDYNDGRFSVTVVAAHAG